MNNPFEAKPHFSIFEGPETFAYTQSAGGDFSHLTPEQRIASHANWVQRYYEAAFQQGTPKDVVVKSKDLKNEIEQFRQAIREPRYQTALDVIATSFVAADLLTLNQPKEIQAAARLELFDGLQIVSDMDGTMTSNPHEYIPHRIPGSYTAEPHMAQHGRETFAEMFAGIWQPVLERDPKTFQDGGKTAKIREGVNEFLAYAKDIGADFSVLTANFDAVAQGVLAQIPNAVGTKVYAITKDSILATAKAAILDSIAVRNPRKALLFFGDGGSDIEALEARGVALYFALKDSVFAKQLEQKRKLYLPYTTFTDNQVQLEKIRSYMRKTQKAA